MLLSIVLPGTRFTRRRESRWESARALMAALALSVVTVPVQADDIVGTLVVSTAEDNRTERAAELAVSNGSRDTASAGIEAIAKSSSPAVTTVRRAQARPALAPLRSTSQRPLRRTDVERIRRVVFSGEKGS